MRKIPVTMIFNSILLLCAAACILQPVMAENGTITIAYRGSGGSYIGETIVFDGRNTYGNATLIKITGPNLPSDGVQVNNLNAPSGTATSVGVDSDGRWKYVWYASSVPGLEKLKTARYTFTATDSSDSTKSATTSYMLKKPEFYITVSPNPSNPGDYIELIGFAEQGITSAKIEISDISGTVLHTFTSPVGSSGYMSYGFHGDLAPGQYTVTVSTPSLKDPYRTVMTVVAPVSSMTVPSVVTVPVTPDVTGETPPAPASPTLPARSPVLPATILAALIVSIVLMHGSLRR